MRTQIATEQEKLLGEKDQELEKTRQELAQTKDKLRETTDKVCLIKTLHMYFMMEARGFCVVLHQCSYAAFMNMFL